jgi:D-glycero-D-manno-heptose 1,7-bisphosphate phosphatase
MILRAFSDLHIDRNRSFLIGDKESDIEAAHRAGIPGFLFSGGNLAAFLNKCLAQIVPEQGSRRSDDSSQRPSR